MMKPQTDTPRRHPFRARLPKSAMAAVDVPNEDSDLKLFVVSFTAFFICFYTFLL